MSTTRLKGIIAAAATPLRADGKIDIEKLVAHCRRLLDLGCDGIQQRVPVLEVPVDGVGRHPDDARKVAQSKRVGAAGPCRLEPGLDQRLRQVSVMVGLGVHGS